MKRASPEAALQRTIVAYLIACVPKPPKGPAWTAINPIPAKSKAAAGLSKALGMKAGVPDFLFVYRSMPVFVELKAPGRTLSKDQHLCWDNLHLAGAECHLVRSLDEFKHVLAVMGVKTRDVG